MFVLKHLHTLRIPGKLVTGVTWELNSLRIALAVDSFIYFANIRHDYKVNLCLMCVCLCLYLCACLCLSVCVCVYIYIYI